MSQEKIRKVQEDYFRLLADNPLLSRCKFLDDGRFSVPKELLDSDQLHTATRHGSQPAAVFHAESLMNDVHAFWMQNSGELRDAIKDSSEVGIHIDNREFGDVARRYLPFFDQIYVSDQLLMLREGYVSSDHLADWRNLVITSIQTVLPLLKHKRLFLPDAGPSLALIFPPGVTLDTETQESLNDSSNALAVDFFSSLFGRAFSTPIDYIEYARRSKPTSTELDPAMLATLFGKLKATDFTDYHLKLHRSVLNGEGSDWVIRDGLYQVMFLDIASRIREFERFGLDAASIHQQAEIDRTDSDLYEWWFRQSARATNRSLGLGFDENFLFKAATASADLGFLDSIPLDEISALRSNADCRVLRDDLRISSLRVQSALADLPSIIDQAGRHVQAAIDRFAASETAELAKQKKEMTMVSLGFGASCLLTIASAALPLLSVVSVLWGKSIADIWGTRKEHESRLNAPRPISVLVRWAKRHGGGNGAAV